jgi:Domain of unknown function (DUF4270)
MYTRFFKLVCSIFAFVFIISCDKDYNEIGSGLVADNHYDFLTKDDFTVNAYNRRTGPVQTDNLETNFLGIYNNPTLAKTTFSYATEVQLNELNPTVIDNSPVGNVIEVVLNIPYFSTLTQLNADGTRTYTLNNFIGSNINSLDPSNTIKLSVFRTTYGITNISVTPPFLNEPQRHYSNQFLDFNSSIIGTRLNDNPISSNIQNDNFVFSNQEITNTDHTIAPPSTLSPLSKTPPALKFFLNNDLGRFIKNASTTNLATNEAFKQYFGNLLFKVEQSGLNPGSMAQLNFKLGTITVYYQDKTSLTNADVVPRKIVLNLNGNAVALHDNLVTPSTYGGLQTLGNPATGPADQSMILKGGEGAMGVLNLFSGTELAQLRNPKVVINDATLVFKVKNSGADNPERIYLYDMDNQFPVYDYILDQSTSSTYNQGKVVLGGFLETDAITGEKFYKVRITNYIRNLVNDPTLINVKIGVTVCKNIVNTRFGRISSILPFDVTNWNNASIIDNVAKNKYYYPETAVINPFGVVLHGTYPVGDPNYNNRVKLVIKYSKPN